MNVYLYMCMCIWIVSLSLHEILYVVCPCYIQFKFIKNQATIPLLLNLSTYKLTKFMTCLYDISIYKCMYMCIVNSSTHDSTSLDFSYYKLFKFMTCIYGMSMFMCIKGHPHMNVCMCLYILFP